MTARLTRTPIKFRRWWLPIIWMVVIVLLVAVYLLGVSCGQALAAPASYNENRLVRAVLTEAVGEGEEGMYAVACAFRNRMRAGLPLGSCGARRKDADRFIARQPASLRRAARIIVRRVFVGNAPDIVDGATHFEGVRFKTPSWVLDGSHVRVKRIRQHVFYKKAARSKARR